MIFLYIPTYISPDLWNCILKDQLEKKREKLDKERLERVEKILNDEIDAKVEEIFKRMKEQDERELEKNKRKKVQAIVEVEREIIKKLRKEVEENIKIKKRSIETMEKLETIIRNLKEEIQLSLDNKDCEKDDTHIRIVLKL